MLGPPEIRDGLLLLITITSHPSQIGEVMEGGDHESQTEHLQWLGSESWQQNLRQRRKCKFTISSYGTHCMQDYAIHLLVLPKPRQKVSHPYLTLFEGIHMGPESLCKEPTSHPMQVTRSLVNDRLLKVPHLLRDLPRIKQVHASQGKYVTCDSEPSNNHLLLTWKGACPSKGIQRNLGKLTER